MADSFPLMFDTEGGADEFRWCRFAMVEEQIRRRGVRDPRVLDAMRRVPRHLFVAARERAAAYADEPLPIGEGQTISQPYMVASMAEALELSGAERVLEVGAGCGYQAAVLSLLAREIIAVEAIPVLAKSAAARMAVLGCKNVRVETGDGSQGWPQNSPFDAILVSAGAPRIPQPLIEQLAPGGRMIIPVGPADAQMLTRVRKDKKEELRILREVFYACRFVPLRGLHGWPTAASG